MIQANNKKINQKFKINKIKNKYLEVRLEVLLKTLQIKKKVKIQKIKVFKKNKKIKVVTNNLIVNTINKINLPIF